MILEAKNAKTLNFATTKPSFRAQNAESWSVTGYSQLAPDFEIPCLGPCRARFGKGGYLAVLRDSQQNPKHMCAHVAHALWNSRLLTPCCLLVLYLLGRVFQKLHDRLQIFMFLIGFSSCFWLSFGPFLHFLHRWLSAACWFALWFQLCGQALASSGTWHEWFWWILFYSVPALRDDHFSSWASIRKLRFVWHLNRLALRSTILRQARHGETPCETFLLKVWFRK